MAIRDHLGAVLACMRPAIQCDGEGLVVASQENVVSDGGLQHCKPIGISHGTAIGITENQPLAARSAVALGVKIPDGTGALQGWHVEWKAHSRDTGRC